MNLMKSNGNSSTTFGIVEKKTKEGRNCHRCLLNIDMFIISVSVRQQIVASLQTKNSLAAGSHQFWPDTFHRSKMETLGSRQPDILMSHVRDSEAIDELMPRRRDNQTTTIYFTAVRDPVTLLESAYNYFAMGMSPEVL